MEREESDSSVVVRTVERASNQSVNVTLWETVVQESRYKMEFSLI